MIIMFWHFHILDGMKNVVIYLDNALLLSIQSDQKEKLKYE